jgi:hypothetical protein
LKSFNTLTNYFAFEHDGALNNEIEFLKILELSKALAQTFFSPHENIHKNLLTHIPHKIVDTQKVFKQFVIPMNLYSLTQKQTLRTKLDSLQI